MLLKTVKQTCGLMALLLWLCACQSDAPTPPVSPPIQVDTNVGIPNNGRNETLSYKNKTNALQLQDIFTKIPAESWQTPSFKRLDKTVKQELLEKGISTPFMAEGTNHCLQVKEMFQSEDDDREQRNIAEIAVFSYTAVNKWLIFVSEQSIRKDKPQWPKLVKQSFWNYDGKTWSNADNEVPAVSEAMFFDNPPAIMSNKNEPLMLQADAKKPDLLNVIVPEKLLESNLQHSVSLVWNGERFEVQIK